MAFRKIPRLKGIKKDSRAVQKTNTSAVMPETDGLDLSMPTLERSGIKNRISSVIDGLEEGRNLLVGLLEKVNQLPHDTPIAAVEERGRDTSVTSTAGTTDTVHVVVDVSGQIVVHDVGDVGNIETTGSNSSCDQDGATGVSEHLKGTLTLALSAVTVNRGSGEVLIDEEVGQRVCHALGLDEDEGQTSTVSVKDVEQNRALVDVLDVLNLLSNVLRGRTNSADRQENVVLQEVAGQHLDVAGEGGGEHESLAVLNTGHVLTLDDASNLGLETHIKHTISLIEDEVLDVLQRDTTTLYEIDQTSRGSHQEIASTLDLTKLRADVSSTVDDTRSHPGAVGELSRLVVNLGDQLTGWGEDERGGVSLALTAEVASLASGNRRRARLVSLRQNGEEETSSLSGTSLSTSHQVTTAHDDGNGVLLDGCGHQVAGERNVGDQVVVQRGVAEGKDRVWHVLARGLDGNVVVLLEVDTSVLLRRVVGCTEELALDARVGGARNVLAIVPSTIPRAPSVSAAAAAAAATSGGGTSVRGRVERAALLSTVVPALAGRASPVGLGTLLEGSVVAVDQSASVGVGRNETWGRWKPAKFLQQAAAKTVSCASNEAERKDELT
ncbi:hypothetical protein VSDG_07154 [Cytospora chrysosperma]|uniref:Uncharacterized protein n=1 Tax=Cytospora chrysosperma TaxID=252740 RepID=A0A423VKD6_CYTCH|nr:hypothetical protein VSDG_07154 [Valsa sordida]